MRRLWRVLGRLRVVSVRLWASWSVLERLGGVWEPLGCILVRLWGAIVAPGRVYEASKTPQKSGTRLEYAAIFNLLSNLTQKGTIFVNFRSRFCSILERPEGHLGNIADAKKDNFYKIKTPILVKFWDVLRKPVHRDWIQEDISCWLLGRLTSFRCRLLKG